MSKLYIVKLNLWIWRSSTNDCYYTGVRVEPTFMATCSSSLRGTSLNSSTAYVLTFTFSFKDPWWSDTRTFSLQTSVGTFSQSHLILPCYGHSFTFLTPNVACFTFKKLLFGRAYNSFHIAFPFTPLI